MTAKNSVWVLLVILSLIKGTVLSDSSMQFGTKRISSANKKYSIRIIEKRVAKFFVNQKKLIKKWEIQLPFLPQDILITNDGKRVILIDHYYGNGSSSEATVVLILNEKGATLRSYKLKDFVDVMNVVQTTSTAHWYTGFKLNNEAKLLSVSTTVRQAELADCLTVSPKKGCMLQKPFEELIFDLTTGRLIERKKYR